MNRSEMEILVSLRDEASKKFKSLSQSIQQNSRKIGLGLSAMGAVGILAGRGLVNAALEQQKAQSTLQAVVEKAGTPWASVRDEIMKTTAALERNTNFSQTEQLRMLSQIIPPLGTYENALEVLRLALDAATASGMSATSVSGMLARAMAGQTHVSVSLGRSFDPLIGITDRLTEGFSAVGGAAEANVDPFIQFANAASSLSEDIGSDLLIVLEPAVKGLNLLLDVITQIPAPLRTIMVIAAGVAFAFAAIAGPILLFIALVPSIVTGIAAIAGAMTALKVITMGPLGIGLAVAALATAGGVVAGIMALGEGGIVTRPTLALIGERGPEAVIPLRGGSAGLGGGVTVVLPESSMMILDNEMSRRRLVKEIVVEVRQALRSQRAF